MDDQFIKVTQLYLEFPEDFEEYRIFTNTHDPSSILLHWKYRFPNLYGASVITDNPCHRLNSPAHPLIRGFEIVILEYASNGTGVSMLKPSSGWTADETAEILSELLWHPHR